MKTDVIRVNGIENGFDFDAHYQVKGYRGIAFYALGWFAEYVPVMCFDQDDDGNEIEVESGEFELDSNKSKVVLVMVGDDRRHIFDVVDCQIIPEDGFCRECGQIGCKHNVYA